MKSVIQDCGILADCKYCIHETVKAFGGLDIVISNAVRIYILYYILFVSLRCRVGQSFQSLTIWML